MRTPGLAVSFVVCIACVAGACEGASDPPRQLCDGSSGVRLAYVGPMGGFVDPRTQVMNDNGAWFLFVDGTCHYWARPPADAWADVHAGVLDEATARALVEDLRFDAWPRLAGAHGGVPLDGSPVTFHDGVHLVSCGEGCSNGDDDTELRGLPERGNAWIDRLWPEGTAVTASLRLSVSALGTQEQLPVGVVAAVWPLDTPLATLDEAMTESGYGTGLLVDDVDGVAALRALRARYRASAAWGNGLSYLPFEDPSGQTAGFAVYLRDTIPLEGADGLVPWPAP